MASRKIRIAIAQIDPVVGAFEANVRKIRESYERACAEQARLLMTPELGVCGYPPHDLLNRPEMFERNERAVQELAAITRGKPCALIVGHVARNTAARGREALNMVSVLQDGQVVFTQAKSLLPTYDVFDEARYFEPAEEIRLWDCDGIKIGVAICEDLWARDPSLGRQLYTRDPIDSFCDLDPDLLLSISASPYEWGKRQRREEVHCSIAKLLGAPLVYVNQIGANDEILFDGGSFVAGSDGVPKGRLCLFKPSFGTVDITFGAASDLAGGETFSWSSVEREDQAPSELEVMHRGLVVGIRDYFRKTGFKEAIVGLSGGIDSAVVCALAAEALGAENVLGVAMPSMVSSGHSLADADALAKNLGIRFEVRPIKFMNSVAAREIGEPRGGLAPLALENLQARLRGLILMTLANHYGALVLTTGNKSEMAVGYCTQYGDMVGALAPIGDVFKMRVYELARQINRMTGNPIPESTLTKAPSAELAPDQKDEDTLPPYVILDQLLADYLEKRHSVDQLKAKYTDIEGAPSKDWVERTLRMVEISEYKRRQAAPVLKTSVKAFGMGRRIPIAKTWDVK